MKDNNTALIVIIAMICITVIIGVATCNGYSFDSDGCHPPVEDAR